MLQSLFAYASGFLNPRNLLRGLARKVFGLRIVTSRLRKPALPSPQPRHLLEAPIAPLELLKEFRTPSSSGGLIVVDGPPLLVLPSPIPTRSQSSFATFTSDRLPDLVPLLLLFAFISGFVILLPGLVYVCRTIANRNSALSRLSRKISTAFSLIFSLVPVFSLVPYFFSTLIFSRHLVSLVSLLLLWTGPPAIASFFTLIYIINIIFKLQIFQKFSNLIVGFLQRCGLLTQRDTRTPPILNTIYDQIVNGTVTYDNFVWRTTPAGPKQEQRPTFTGVVTSSHLDIQLPCREQELLASLAQHELDLEEEKQHRLRTQRIYSEFLDSQNSLRRQLEVSRTREGELQADLLAAEAKRRKLKDLIATLEASEIALRVDIKAAGHDAHDAAIMIDHQSRLAAENDHVIRSTTNDLLAVRAELRDAEDKIARLDAELQSERDLRIRRETELSHEQARLRDAKDKIARLDAELQSERDIRIHRTNKLLYEQTKTRSLHEAEMRRIAKKAEDVQGLLDLLDDLLSRSRARTQSPLDDKHIPRLRNHAIAIEPGDTGQPPPPPLKPIPDVHTPSLDPITERRSPFSPKSLRQTPEHDPPTRHPPDHPRQISACFDRVSDTANSWRARLKNLIETIVRLEAERALEAESRELSELCLQEELAGTKDQLLATQEELAGTKEQLRAAQKDASNVRRELDQGREALQETKAHIVDFKREMETSQAKLKDVQDARRANIVKYSEAVELLRLRSADLQSLKAEAEASRSKHSQAISLSNVLRKRVMILEAELKSLDRNQKCAEMHPALANSQSFCTADTDPIPTTHSADNQTEDSSHMKLSLSLRSFLDSSLPPSPSGDLLPSSSDQLHTIISLDNVPLSLNPPQRLNLSSIPHTPPPSWTRRCSVAFLPVGSSVGSMDWPPIGSTLRPSGKNSERDSGVSKAPPLPLPETDHAPSTSRNPSNIPFAQITKTSRSLVFGDPGRRFRVHRSTPFRPINAMTIKAPPNSAPASPRHLSPTTSPSHSPSCEDVYMFLDHEEILSTPPRDHSDPTSISALSSLAQPPSPRCSSPAQLSQFVHSRLSLSRHRELSHPFRLNDPMRLTASDLLGIRHTSPSASVRPEAAPESALSIHTPRGSPPMAGGGADAPALNRNTRSTPQSPLPRLLPGLLDPILLREHAIRDDDSPCAFGKRRRNSRLNQYQAPPVRRQCIQTIDYGLPEGFIPGTGGITPERFGRGLDEDFAQDFAFIIPLDRPTSTPVALSRRLTSKQRSSESDVKPLSFGHLPLSLTPPPRARRRVLNVFNHRVRKSNLI